jgi:PAS domain S-box-containing protein
VHLSHGRAHGTLLSAFAVVAVVVFAISVRHDPLVWPLAVAAVTLFAAFLASLLLLVHRARRSSDLEHDAADRLQRQLTATAATSGGWVYVISPDGRFVYSSEASLECIGYEPHELIGREARSLLSRDESAHIDTRVGDPRSVDVVVVRGEHKDGTDRWFEVTIAPILGDDGGEVLGYSGTARAVTDTQHPAVVRELHRREITEVLGSERLGIAFQPIIDLETGRMVGVEALARFPSLQGTTPDVVFARATNAGLGLDLELLAVRRALAEARLLAPGLYVTVNVSPQVLANPSLVDALVASGMDPRRLVVEITEHASVADYTVLEQPRQRLRDLGVRLAIDDAGAGYASLRHIVTLSPDMIKIDRGLVADVDTDRARRALVMAVVVYAMEIGTTTVVGEGVETLSELEALKDLGVDAAQGYLIGRPTTEPSQWFSWAGDTVHTIG